MPVRPQIGKTLKPYQGLKLTIEFPVENFPDSRKNPKTLSGIETVGLSLLRLVFPCRKNPKPYQGLKPARPCCRRRAIESEKP